MSGRIASVVIAALLAVHAGLGLWAGVGFAELVVPEVPWPRLSNPLFSPSMLVLQWSLVGVAAAVFLAGYVRRWRHTPVAMLLLYGAMALVCAYQTFRILTSPHRFLAMAAEFAVYAGILAFLFLARPMRSRFERLRGYPLPGNRISE